MADISVGAVADKKPCQLKNYISINQVCGMLAKLAYSK
jgi:hypothetical protein